MSRHSCPSNKVIEYLYEEMSETEKEKWVPIFFQNQSSAEELNEFLNIKEQLDEIQVKPSQSCISKILSFL